MPQRGHFGTLQRRQTVGGHPCQTLRGEPPPPEPAALVAVPQRPSEKKAGGGRHGLAVARHGIGASGTIGHAQRALFLENRWRSRHLAWGSHTPIIAVEKSLVVAY